jgi:hypothetical protein
MHPNVQHETTFFDSTTSVEAVTSQPFATPAATLYGLLNWHTRKHAPAILPVPGGRAAVDFLPQTGQLPCSGTGHFNLLTTAAFFEPRMRKIQRLDAVKG